MTSQYFADLFEYDSTVNRQLLNKLRSLQQIDEKTKSIFSHLINARKVWIKRLNHEGLSGVAIWPEMNWDECEALIEENRKAYQNFLIGKTDSELESKLEYKNSKGIGFLTPVRDILMHVLLHGSYHRGQIARAIRQSGEEPINTDYILYVRNKE